MHTISSLLTVVNRTRKSKYFLQFDLDHFLFQEFRIGLMCFVLYNLFISEHSFFLLFRCMLFLFHLCFVSNNLILRFFSHQFLSFDVCELVIRFISYAYMHGCIDELHTHYTLSSYARMALLSLEIICEKIYP